MSYTKPVRKFLLSTFVITGVLLLMTPQAWARIVNKVDIHSRATGYEININFFLPLRYISHRPTTRGKILRIQMRPGTGIGLDDPETLTQLTERQILSWDKEIPIPLQEITYEGELADRPNLTVRFLREVEFQVRSSADLRTLVIVVRTEKPVEEKKVEVTPETSLLGILTPNLGAGDPREAELMDEAGGAMIDGDFRRAIQLYTKILGNPKSAFRRDAQELLGLARERNKQLAHAKAEYEKYLELYPEGQGAQRVSQRLAGLLTAVSQPKDKLRQARRPGTVEEKTAWVKQFFGSISEFYNYSDTEFETGQKEINQSQSLTSLDLNTRFRSDRYEIRTQFFGSHEVDLREHGPDSVSRINNLFIDMEDREWGLSGRLGRQSQSSGGILGRFDGGTVGYQVHSLVKVNGVFGYPVLTTKTTEVETAKHFYGLNLDIGTLGDNWDFNIFGINQEVDGILDRRSVGGEIRYFHPTRSMFSFLDYDVSFNEVNIFLLNTGWTFSTQTRVNLIFDHRKSPILTTSNAIIGQGVTEVSDLLTILTEDQIRQLAQDRTASSTSLTLSITQDLSEKYQVVGEVTTTDLSSTPATTDGFQAVPGTPSTGLEYFFLAQFIGSGIFLEGDINIIELRYADTNNNNSFSMNLNGRYPITQNFRVNPRLQTNYRKNKNGNGDSLVLRPLLRVDYRWKNWLRFELEGGREWRQDTALGTTDATAGYFARAGFRAYF